MQLKALVLFFTLMSTGLFAQNSMLKVREFLEQGKIDEAAFELEKVPKDTAEYYRLLGNLFLRKGQLEEAIAMIGQGLSMLESGDNKDTEIYAKCLNDLGNAHWNLGNQTEALTNLLASKDIRLQIFGEQNEALASSYNDIGLVYSLSQPEVALDYYEKALAIYNKYRTENIVKIAQANVNIGIIQTKLGIYGTAIDNFDEAITIWQEIYGRNHVNEAFVRLNLGQAYQAFGDNETALEEYMNALHIYQQNYGTKHPEIANTYNLLGNFFFKERDFESALSNYQLSVVSNLTDFESTDYYVNPPLKNYYNAGVLINALLFKSRALEMKHLDQSLRFSDLRASLSTLELAAELVDKTRNAIRNEEDKLLLGQAATEIYETGVRVAEYMSRVAVSKRRIYREKAFYFAEKSKSSVLLESISETDAKQYAKIPNELLRKEERFKSSIAYYEQKLAEKPIASMERSFRTQLFQITREYNDFINELEREFPEYHRLKYNVAIPAVTDIQEALDDQTALISYFLEEQQNRVYIFVITRSRFRILHRGITANFDRFLSGIRNSIFYGDQEVYALTAFDLNKNLNPGNLGAKIKRLVIVPAGRLGVIPFEALLLSEGKEGDSYADYNYWIDRYAISYAFSSTLYLQNLKEESTNQSNNIFLCAPVTFDNFDIRLADLPGTRKEIEAISSIFESNDATVKAITGEDANEELIKSNSLRNYRYLHFATHGVVDEYHPELSNIFLQQAAFEDGYLYTGEILNLDINADLVTLSACQTGLGKVSKGEGIIGLSRALYYAGAKNLVVSLWSVADESTSQLMTTFYQHVAQDYSSEHIEPLRIAKLKLKEDPKYDDPFYWAPFILIGK
jgi:CHAT domain-containing protein/Tfp pilus assembly protein PilF